MGISPHTELKHTNTTNRIYKYKASAIQDYSRQVLIQIQIFTGNKIRLEELPWGEVRIESNSTNTHKHIYTRSLLLVSIFGIESNSKNTHKHTHEAYFWFLLLE